MDIMDRVRALPQELQDAISPYVLLPETSPFWAYTGTYDTPLPRIQARLPYLVSLMHQILGRNHGLGWAQATLCIVRLVEMYDLFHLIPDSFFRPYLDLCTGHYNGSRFREFQCGMLEASGFLRLSMLARECSKARGDDPPSNVAKNICHKHFFFDALVEYSEEMYFLDIPTFLLWAVDRSRVGCYQDDEDWFIEMWDDNVQALYVDADYEKIHWLRRQDGPWMLTTEYASIKTYNEDGSGGVVEWSLGENHFQIEFDNATNPDANAYLRYCNKAALQAHSDAELAREIEKERLRGATMALLSKEERAKRTAQQGRFWCLG